MGTGWLFDKMGSCHQSLEKLRLMLGLMGGQCRRLDLVLEVPLFCLWFGCNSPLFFVVPTLAGVSRRCDQVKLTLGFEMC